MLLCGSCIGMVNPAAKDKERGSHILAGVNMTILLPSKPSDLLERIISLQISDPTNNQLPVLVEREHDLLKGHSPEGIAHPTFKSFIEQLIALKKQIQCGFTEIRRLREELYAKAMESNPSAQDFQTLVRQLSMAEQTYAKLKNDVDALISPSNSTLTPTGIPPVSTND